MARQRVKVVDRGFKRIMRSIRAMAGRGASVGIHANEAQRTETGSLSNVQLGVVHEFGAPEAGIPERSFLRSSFDANRRKYETILTKGAKRIAGGRDRAERVLGIAAEVAVADVINTINAGVPPANAPSTVRRKGSSKPLVDTGQLKASIKPVVGRSKGSR